MLWRFAIGGALVVAVTAASPAVAQPRCGGVRAGPDALGPPTSALAWRARLVDRVPVRRYLGRPPATTVDPDAAEAVLVLDAREDARGRCWLRVRLPARPNAASGWISAERVRLLATRWRIVVDRARRSVTLLRDGRKVLRTGAVIGTSGTPTPKGLFAVTSVWRNPADDFLGTWILPLTAHSNVLKTYDGGDGRVALHGRGGASLLDPLGSAASHGCVRLTNAEIGRLVRRVGVAALPGVPVRVM